MIRLLRVCGRLRLGKKTATDGVLDYHVLSPKLRRKMARAERDSQADGEYLAIIIGWRRIRWWGNSSAAVRAAECA